MALPSSSSAAPLHFDVFLSFRGKDTRHNFTSHLLASLLRKGIKAFSDEKLRRGTDILALLDRIERARISIIVFSENFANSHWCLEELVKILECKERQNQVVVPIFYKVCVSDVKNQTASYGVPFDRPEESFRGFMKRIPTWKSALTEASTIAGHVVTEDSSEADLIDKVANYTFKMLYDMWPSETEDLVGIEHRQEKLEKLLCCEKNDRVRAIGVVGMAGIGKTTIARCMFRQLRQTRCLFDSYCFLENIREESKRHGMEHLQRKVLNKLTDEERLDVENLDNISDALRDFLKNKRVLVVLDDVSCEEQIRHLFGHQNRYRNGSRIIITTQDKKLITNVVDEGFEVPGLNYREALKLFSLNAFPNSFCPSKEFMDLSNMFLDYVKGHPLALKLLGLDLSRREKVYWTNKLETLRTNPGGKIQKVFELSCTELNMVEKEVFLDIACFFRSENADYVASLLHSHDYNAYDAIRDLADKSLVTISDDRLGMHSLLHTIGKAIGSQASIIEAGNRRRLWKSEDVCHVLKYISGTEEVRGIFLDLSEAENVNLSPDVFSRMWNLRYLKFYNSNCSRGCEDECVLRLPEGLSFLSDELRYLHWQGFPSDNLPINFYPKNLVDLQLPHSQISKLWEDDKSTEKLKWVDLRHCQNLWNISGLSMAKNLERLNLEGCTSLVRLYPSIQAMHSLVYLSLQECTSLKKLPKGINLKSLKTLNLSGCSSLKKFPLISENLEYLFLDGTAVNKLPKSMENLSKLIVLNLKNCRQLERIPNSLCKLKSLQELVLSGCSLLKKFPEIKEDMKCLEILLMDETAIEQVPDISHLINLKTFSFCENKGQQTLGLSFLPPSTDLSVLTDLYIADCNLQELPVDFSCLPMLQCLSLSRNNFKSVPLNILQLLHLKWLDLQHCTQLQSLPVLPPNLQHLDAHGCESLVSVASPPTHLSVTDRFHSTFIFSNCFKLNRNAQDDMVMYTQMKSQLLANASLKRYHRGFVSEPLASICYPGTDMPVWLGHQRMGSSVTTQLPPHWSDSKFVGFALSAVVSFNDYEDPTRSFSVKCRCKLKDENGSTVRFSCVLGGWKQPCVPGNEPKRINSDHVFLGYISCFHIKEHRLETSELNNCVQTTASFTFSVTDGNSRKLDQCELMKCGVSLMHSLDENDCRFRGLRDTRSALDVSTRQVNFDFEEESRGPRRLCLFSNDKESQISKQRKEEELSLCCQSVSGRQLI